MLACIDVLPATSQTGYITPLHFGVLCHLFLGVARCVVCIACVLKSGRGPRFEFEVKHVTYKLRPGRGDRCCCVWPRQFRVLTTPGLIPVLFLPLFPSFLPTLHNLLSLDMPGDILKKRKIAVLGSRSVGEYAEFIMSDSMLISASFQQASRPS